MKRYEYMAGKGITKEGLHVDGKDESRGYVPGNLQVITNSENVKKYLSYDRGHKGKPCNFKIKKAVVINDDTDLPF